MRRKPHRFYEPIAEESYYVFELQYILGVCRKTVYNILKRCGIKSYKSCIGNKFRTKIKRTELLKLVKTHFFEQYYQKIIKQEVDNMKISTNLESYELNGHQRKKLNLLFHSPEELAKSKLLKMNLQEIKKSLAVGLIPAITIVDQGCINTMINFKYQNWRIPK